VSPWGREVAALEANPPKGGASKVSDTVVFVIVGIVGGIAAGLFGVGGGIVLVPALIYWAGFTQHKATGTSLAVLLPPIGLAATIEYWRHGNVDVKAAAILAATMFVGSWFGAHAANRMKGPHLRLLFGLFVTGMGIYLVRGALKRIGWI
jgi:uncharacterized membrane protein YfcA